MRVEEKLLPGDVLLTSAYLSYVGCFSRNYRIMLMEEKWMPFLKKLEVIRLFDSSAFILLIPHTASYSTD